MKHDEMIAIIQAHKAGKVIQCKYLRSKGTWGTIEDDDVDFNFEDFIYRIKPQKKVMWVNFYGHTHSYYYDSEEVADQRAGTTRLFGRAIRVEVEE